MDGIDTENDHDRITAVIEHHLRTTANIRADDAGFGHHTDLFDSGYVDSLALVALTAFLEDTFAITLTEDDLFAVDFTTIAGIARLIVARQAARLEPDIEG